MKRLPSLKLTEKRVQGGESGGFKSDVRSTDASRVLFRLFERGTTKRNEREENRRWSAKTASHRGVIICSSFGRRVVGEKPERDGMRERESEGGRGRRGCMQTAVRGGLLTPFIHPSIHPSLVKPSDAREIVPRV